MSSERSDGENRPSRVGRFRLGYRARDVDALLARIANSEEGRQALDTAGLPARGDGAVGVGAHGSSGALAPGDISGVTFSLVGRGYLPDEVDLTLDRIADALATQSARSVSHHHHHNASRSAPTAEADELVLERLERLERPAGRRFARPARLGRGYDCTEVDRICELALATLDEKADHDEATTPREIRLATFRRRSGSRGYDEGIVDHFCDRLAEMMAAEK